MKFAVYHPWLYVKSGLERLVLEQLERSRHEWTCYTNHLDLEGTFPEFAKFRVRQIGPKIPPPMSAVDAMVAAAGITATRLPEDGSGAVLLCLNGLSDLALVRTRRPVVGHCLTPIKALHDPHALQSLREQKPRRYQMVRMLGAPFQVADKALWRRIDHVVAISEETKRRVVSAGLRAPDDVAVIHPGVDVEHFSVGETSRDPVLLSAGRISWHKNIELAIDTLREVRARGLPLRLVVAGYVDGPGESYLAALRSRATDLPVDFVRDPSDEQVAALYRTSEAVLFTPRNEDFGLVPLEAMACGTPVVATNQGGPRETVVDGVTGFLAEPTATAFADAVEKVVRRTDRTSMVSAARARAEDFSWSRYVTAMDDAMELTASKPQRRGR